MRSLALLAAGLMLGLTQPSLAETMGSRPVVVELFTSQGCSSCPPANDNLTAVSDRPDVLALSFGVTYWDYLGWKDSFAKPEYTTRQYNYERTLHRATAYTPQMVIDGQSDIVGADAGELDQAIAAAAERNAAKPATTVALAGDKVEIGAGAAQADAADVWLVRYDPNVVQVPVARGENGGRTLPHKNVVHELTRLGGWDGSAESFDLPPAMDGLKTAILVQAAYTGPILAAAKN
ncbi:MAG TPA: DUF1223 domain-containing protein [Candidatus Binatia bacterium]|nr:DUF1223 domain-containing protein [Candidatus Binatia bacterium]